MIVKEAGEAVATTVDALKSTPVVLTLFVFMLVYVGFSFYTQVQERAAWKELVESAMKWCPASKNEPRP